MKFKVDGRELSAEGMRVRELVEAEKYLQMNMGEGTGAAIAIQFFVALRRETPDKPVLVVADEALDLDVTTLEIEGEDEAGPPAQALVGNGTSQEDPVRLPTSGPRRSASVA